MVIKRTAREVTVQNERGTAVLTRLKPGVLLYTCAGFYTVDFYAPMVEPAQREIEESKRLVMLVDGWELGAIDTGYRERWTEWFRKYKADFRMTLLVRTKLMEMAASIANLFTGVNVIKTYSSIREWEKACARDVPQFTRGRAA